jgi:hypothetical protein
VIYCVVPQALADELYDRLAEYYRDDDNVKVIIDRREGADRRGPRGQTEDSRREIRDRRIKRPVGSFPPIEPTV